MKLIRGGISPEVCNGLSQSPFLFGFSWRFSRRSKSTLVQESENLVELLVR